MPKPNALGRDDDHSAAAPMLALRIRSVAEARRIGGPEDLAGELDLLAEAATEWAVLIRARTAAPPNIPRNPCSI